MCAFVAPLIPLLVTAATTAIGTALSVAQQSQQAEAQRASLNYQAAMARNAATAAEYNAQAVEQAGEVEEDKLRRKAALLIGAQQARFAGQGTDLSGTPLDLLADTAGFGEEDALGLRFKVQYDAWKHRVQASSSLAQAGFYGLQASNVDPSIGIAKSLLGGLGSVGSSFGGMASWLSAPSRAGDKGSSS